MPTALTIFEETFIDTSIGELNLSVSKKPSPCKDSIKTVLLWMVHVFIDAPLSIRIHARYELIFVELPSARVALLAHKLPLALLEVLLPIAVIVVPIVIYVDASALLLASKEHSRVYIAVSILNLAPLEVLQATSLPVELTEEYFSIGRSEHSIASSAKCAPLIISPSTLVDSTVCVEANARAISHPSLPMATIEVTHLTILAL